MKSNWRKCEFQELYYIPSRNGLSKPSKIRGNGYKMINMGELFSNDRIYDIPMELVPLNEAEKVAKIEKNDLLFARQSLVASGAGKCSIVMEVSPLTVFESHIIRVRLDDKIANPLFYYYYFKSSHSPIKTIIQHNVQAGIKASDLAKLIVDVPPIDEQEKIAKILSTLDQKIELNSRLIETLNQIGRALFDDYSQKTNKKEIATSLLNFERGVEPGSKNYYPEQSPNMIRFIRVGDMLNDTPENYVDKSLCQNSILEETDIAMSFDATIGRVSYGITGGFSSGLRKVSSNNPNISNAFIYYYLTSEDVQKTLLEYATGTAILHAGKAIDYLQLPYQESATKILSNRLNCIFSKQLSLKRQNNTLSNLRDTLLPRIINDEINIEKVNV